MNVFALFRRCQHPIGSLVSLRPDDRIKAGNDFERVTHFYRCACGAEVTHSHAELIGGVDAFISRAGDDDKC